LVGIFFGFAQSFSVKRTVPPCHFSKEFCATTKNVLTNRKRGFYSQVSKVPSISQNFGVKDTVAPICVWLTVKWLERAKLDEEPVME
jgi:hypothetical protein